MLIALSNADPLFSAAFFMSSSAFFSSSFALLVVF
jgi:hypothetical protein